MSAEPGRAPWAEERGEGLRGGETERVRGSVRRRDERDAAPGRRAPECPKIMRNGTRQVGVDDEDRPRVHLLEGRCDGVSLSATRIRQRPGAEPPRERLRPLVFRHDRRLADGAAGCQDVPEHREREPPASRVGQGRQAGLGARATERNDDRRHCEGDYRGVDRTIELDNAAIADRLEAFAALLELAGASYYTARAYRRAAELIRSTPAPVAALVRAGKARELRGIGPGIETRLRELVETGDLSELRELEDTLAPELVGLGHLVGVAPKRMVEIGRVLGIRTAEELRAAAVSGRLASVAGIGPKTEQRLLEGLSRAARPRPRRGLLLNRAWELAGGVAAAVGGEVAGHPRRWRDSSERFAVVSAADDAEPLLGAFERLPQIVSLLERSARQALGVTVDGVPIQLVVAEPQRFGTEFLRATGSRAYVEALEPLPDAPDEETLYRRLGIPFCPPELREQPWRGEPPAGLLGLEYVRGDLHCHTVWSDGKASVLEMGRAALELGYEYLAVCDHTRSVRVVPGLDAEDVRRQGEEIAAANAELAPLRLLHGIECDILPDGTLDLPDDVLVDLDWVQISLHAGQRAGRAELTKRVVEAMRHPAASCLSHPTGRLINHRPPNALDLERVLEVALETGVALEVNGLPDRLDLRDDHVRLAVAAGVPIICSTDAHSTRGLGNMRLAVATARRGGAVVGGVVNTRPLAELELGRART
jgi:DNA polymerase (family X)